jgi:hypothetical protein
LLTNFRVTNAHSSPATTSTCRWCRAPLLNRWRAFPSKASWSNSVRLRARAARPPAQRTRWSERMTSRRTRQATFRYRPRNWRVGRTRLTSHTEGTPISSAPKSAAAGRPWSSWAFLLVRSKERLQAVEQPYKLTRTELRPYRIVVSELGLETPPFRNDYRPTSDPPIVGFHVSGKIARSLKQSGPFHKPKSCCESQTIELAESTASVLVIGVSGSLVLALAGLLFGAWLSQFFPRPTPFLLFLPSLIMNVGLGLLLIRRAGRVETGKAIMVGGTIASLALPFILL